MNIEQQRHKISQIIFPNEPAYIDPEKEFNVDVKDNIVELLRLYNEQKSKNPICLWEQPDDLKFFCGLIFYPDISLACQAPPARPIQTQSFQEAVEELDMRYDEYMKNQNPNNW